MNIEIVFSGQEKRLANALSCSPELVRFVWQELKLDNFEDVQDVKQLTEISKTYGQMIKQTEKLKHLYGTLPEDERQRLNIEAQLQGFVHGADKLEALLNVLIRELNELMAHREHVKERNPIKGGKNPRADQLAELVARIFEETKRPITYGHREELPTTDFGRAVQKTIEICEAKLLDTDEGLYLSNWRQPAHKAFVKRNA